jgi:hypothetical protein
VDQCSRITPTTPGLRVDHLPFASELVSTGCIYCFYGDPFDANELHMEMSLSSHASAYVALDMGQSCLSTDSQRLLCLPLTRERNSLVHVSLSGSECGAALNFSMISRSQSFGFSHRPLRKISALGITQSTPLGSVPHLCNQLHTPCCSRASNL